MMTNPPLGRRRTAHPRRRRAAQKPAMREQGTQTPPVQTLQGHADRHQALEAKARSFAMTLERHNMPDTYEAQFPHVSLSIAAGRDPEP